MHSFVELLRKDNELRAINQPQLSIASLRAVSWGTRLWWHDDIQAQKKEPPK